MSGFHKVSPLRKMQLHRRAAKLFTFFDWQSCLVVNSCPTLCNPRQPVKLLCPRDFPGKNTGVGCHCLLHRIFLTHGSNPYLCIGRWILNYCATRKANLEGCKFGKQCHPEEESLVNCSECDLWIITAAISLNKGWCSHKAIRLNSNSTPPSPWYIHPERNSRWRKTA